MAQPIKRTAIGAAAATAESGIGGGILGGLAGIVGGGLLGAAAMALVGAAVLGAGGLAIAGGISLIGAAIGIPATFTLIGVAAAGAQIGAIGGAVFGGVGGAYYGGIAGGVIGAIKGVTSKASGINADERMAANIGKDKQLEQMQQVAAIREQTLEQYAPGIYQQAVQDMQQAQAAEQNKAGFVDKLAKERGVDPVQLAAASHADQAKASKEATDHAALGA